MTASVSPRVSVVMSVYNGMPHLVEAMESLCAQTYGDAEFVVIDDGSTDNSRAVIQSFADRDSRIRLISQENAGLTKALIRGVSEARGEYIARMDADDLSEPERLARQVAALDAAPNAAAATCTLRRFREDGYEFLHKPARPAEVADFLVVFFNVIAGHGQMMFRKSAYDLAGGYDADFRYAQDHDLWSRLLRHGELLTQDEPLYRYRDALSSSITSRHRSQQDDCSYRVSERAYEELTGVMLPRDLAEQARHFWVFDRRFELDREAARRVDEALRRAARAYLGKGGVRAGRRTALHAAIAGRWFKAMEARRPSGGARLAMDCYLRAVLWSPPFAVAGLRLFIRRGLDRLTRRQTAPQTSDAR